MSSAAWTVPSVVITALSLATALYLYFFPREPRAKLAWDITQDRPLLQAGRLGMEHLVLMSYDTPIEQPWVWAAEIVNVGRRTIRATDFDQPFRFIFNSGDNLLQLQAVGDHTALSYFGDFGPDGEEYVLGFDAQLLNRGEKPELVTLWDGQPEVLRPDYRFAGNVTVSNASAKPQRLDRDSDNRETAAFRWGAIVVFGYVVLLAAFVASMLIFAIE